MIGKHAMGFCWLVCMMGLVYYFALQLTGNDKRIFLPGQTSSGHYQIELACKTCHGEPFSGKEDMQKACLNCHGEELKSAKDSHPKSKFTDPRNADRIKGLDALHCVSCHVEHKPEITTTMGLTLPIDLCVKCHGDIAEDRPSHSGLAFTSCADAGCHNYHDNRALYEDFQLSHLHEPQLLARRVLPLPGYGEFFRKTHAEAGPLTLADHDAPAAYAADDALNDDWSATAHAGIGVNCSDCHRPGIPPRWIERPDYRQCEGCHENETKGFLHGKHGMRLNEKLSAMRPGLARLPMKTDSLKKNLQCVSCHRAHQFDTGYAAVEACLGCHDDEHSLAYKKSVHYRLWVAEQAGTDAKGSGVSCARCHLPPEQRYVSGLPLTLTQHNQNDNLRPNEKMLRSVCMFCHGLGFSMDALADQQLVKSNFIGKPRFNVKSLEMATVRAASHPRKKNKGENHETKN